MNEYQKALKQKAFRAFFYNIFVEGGSLIN